MDVYLVALAAATVTAAGRGTILGAQAAFLAGGVAITLTTS